MNITPNFAAASQGPPGPPGSQGIQGEQGPPGMAFVIAKTYANTAALEADTHPVGITAGQFAIISDIGFPDNGDLWLWNGTVYVFVTNVAGLTSAQGPMGLQGIQGIPGPSGVPGQIQLISLGYFDASSGLAVGTANVANPIAINAKSIIVAAWWDVLTPFTSAGGTATLELSAVNPGDTLAATLATDIQTGTNTLIEDSSGANAVKVPAATILQATVGVEPLTGGKAKIFALLMASD